MFVDRLIDWLRNDIKPDLVHLSNVMLIAMAPEIQRRLHVPVVCGLSGEDIFLEEMLEPHYAEVRSLLKQRAGDVDAYVSLSRYYADYMTDYMELDTDRVHVIPHGLKLEGHGTRSRAEGEEFTIGYFARICHQKGLHNLIDAFRLLCEQDDLPPLRLRAAGYLGDGDKAYLAKQQKRLRTWGLEDRFEYLGEPDRAGKIKFLQSFDVMSVPTVYHESKGLSILEAMANAVPVVQPAHGAFPELIEDTGGGVLCEPDNPAALAAALRSLIQDPEAASAHGLRGQAAVRDRYDAETMAERTLALYRQLTTGFNDPAESSEGKEQEVEEVEEV